MNSKTRPIDTYSYCMSDSDFNNNNGTATCKVKHDNVNVASLRVDLDSEYVTSTALLSREFAEEIIPSPNYYNNKECDCGECEYVSESDRPISAKEVEGKKQSCKINNNSEHAIDTNITRYNVQDNCPPDTEKDQKMTRNKTRDEISKEHEFRIKISKTFSLAFSGHTIGNEAETISDQINLKQDSHDKNVLQLHGLENNRGRGKSDCKRVLTLSKHEYDIKNPAFLPHVIMPQQPSMNIKELTKTYPGNIKEIIHEANGVSITDLDSYNKNHKSTFQESKSTTAYVNDEKSANFFPTEIHVISSNKKVDFIAEKNSHLVFVPKSNLFSDHSYYHVNNDKQVEVGKDPNTQEVNCNEKDLSLQTGKLQSVKDTDKDICNTTFENIELSTIFSSLDNYQLTYDHNNVSVNESQTQEFHPSYITNQDNQTYSEAVEDSGGGMFSLSGSDTSESGVYSLSMNDTGTIGLFSRDNMHNHGDLSQSNQSFNTSETLQNSFFQRPEMMYDQASYGSFTISGGMPYPETNTVLQSVHSQHYPEGYHKLATHQSLAALPFNQSRSEKPDTDPCVYDFFLSDNYKQYQSSDNFYYQSTQGCHGSEWTSWSGGGAIHKSYPNSVPSKELLDTKWYTPPIDIKDNVTNPEVVQFFQMDANEDEETDDADEFNDMPLTICATDKDYSDHIAPVSVATSCSDDCSTITDYSPASLTPPPSASSTPVPSSSHGSHTSEDMGYCSPWAISHLEVPDINGTTSRQYPSSKICSEQLETGLLNYGLSQGTKRPFPSMADAMRSTRFKSIAKSKVSDPEMGIKLSKSSGRPRKNQIQSDKISTSTAMNVKTQKKKSYKSTESETTEKKNGQEDTKDRTGSNSEVARMARHNEPLNQLAIEIMTQWFDEHVDNPYPSKSDKEEMARLGGITENQVKSWFANKRNRTNNTKPKVQKRAIEEKLKELFRDMKRTHRNPNADNTHLIQQLSGIIQNCQSTKQE